MRLCIVAILSISTLAFVTPSARANIGSYPCGWNSDPTGLEKIRITNEQLTIDLRACDGSELGESGFNYLKQPVGKVEAIYNLRNDGSAQRVHLLFAAGALIGPDAIQIFMHDRAVRYEPTSIDDPKWRLPIGTPGIDGGPQHYFTKADGTTNFGVRLNIPAGTSTLRVRFRTLIGNDRSALPTCCWQFIYLLAPARDWGGFDKLDVKVLVPAGWKAASNLNLRRDGDVLRGTFEGIPDDALTLTVRMLPDSLREQIELVKQIGRIAAVAWLPLFVIATVFFAKKVRHLVGIRTKIMMLASCLAWGTAAWWVAWCLLLFPVLTPGIPWMQRGKPDEWFIWFQVWILSFAAVFVGAFCEKMLLLFLWRRAPIANGDVRPA